MKDLQKIKEFFSKPVNEAIETPMDAIAFLNANKNEIIKLADQYKGDVSSMQKAIDNFLAPHIDGTPDFIIDKIKAAIGGAISKRNIAANPDLSATYDKLKNVRGVVKEKKETAVDMAKKQLDALGVKYEMSGNKFKPFKVIYKPYNEDLDALYDQEYELTRIYQQDKGKENWEKLSQIREKNKRLEEFEDIIDLFNLGSAVKSSMNEANSFDKALDLRAKKVEIEDEINQLRMEMEDEGDESKANYYGRQLNKLEDRLAKVKKQLDDYDMNEAKFMSGILSGKDFINAKLKNYPKAVAKVNQLIDMIGEDKFTIEMAEWIFDFFNNAHFESPINEAKEEDKVDTITMDIPLFLRMLEYSREDASQDMDLHDVTEKAISLGKERGILQMDDYNEIIGSAEEIKENVAPNHDGKSSPYGSGYKPLEERIAKALDQINEELCPAGKAYRKRRMAAGEKSSAYLSGRAVKVCKGQMSGKKKKK
jgi:hypothetical protein